jgi:hypothetical protein
MNKSEMRGEIADRLSRLIEEHSEIYRSFLALDEATVWGLGRQVLAAAEKLTQLMLQHLVHEAQLLEKISPAVLKDQRTTMVALMADLNEVASGLGRKELPAALRLRGLCRKWLREHLVESEAPAAIADEAQEMHGRLEA